MQRIDYQSQILTDTARYPAAVLRAVRQFRRAKPWQGTLDERKAKFLALHQALCEAYGLTVRLEFGAIHPEAPSEGSFYRFRTQTIVLRGRLSVVTYLHLLTIARRGPSTRHACRWSVNLFRRMFPRSFANCVWDGFILRKA